MFCLNMKIYPRVLDSVRLFSCLFLKFFSLTSSLGCFEFSGLYWRMKLCSFSLRSMSSFLLQTFNLQKSRFNNFTFLLKKWFIFIPVFKVLSNHVGIQEFCLRLEIENVLNVYLQRGSCSEIGLRSWKTLLSLFKVFMFHLLHFISSLY